MNTKNLETTYQLPTYEKLPLVVTHGEGAYVWNEKGKKYLDFYGGHAVALVGHCHPTLIKAVSNQMKKLIFYSNVAYNNQRAQAAKQLVTAAGEAFSSVFFCNSGTEANETAVKLAKKFTGKDEVISFSASFHGRTLGSLSITGFDTYKKYVGSLMPNVQFATLGDIESVKNIITNNTAAIIVEPIQSIAGVYEADATFYKDLRKLCSQKNIVLIFDEVQTGLGRTGKMFYGQHVDVMPDLITLAKGIAGGLPAGAVLVNEKITKSVQLGDQGSTFGGGPIICAAITATLEVLEKEKLIKNASKIGDLLKEKLAPIKHVVGVNGKGLLLGIVLDVPAKQIQMQLLKKGIITGTSSNSKVLRIMPPLTITNKEVTVFIKAFKSVLEEKIYG